MTKHVLHYKSTFTDYKSYELLPINSHKSFYGKAIVTDYGDIKVLRSYGTPVVALNEWSYRRTEAGGYEGWGIWSEVKEVEE